MILLSCECCRAPTIEQICLLDSQHARCLAGILAPATLRGGQTSMALPARAAMKARRVAGQAKAAPALPAPCFPGNVVCEHLAGMFVELVDEFDDSNGCMHTRRMIATVLLKLEGTCRELRNLVRANARLRYYRFFYHTLVANCILPRRFLDGTFGVELFNGDYGAGPTHQSRFAVLGPKDVLQDRVSSAKRLSQLSVVEVKRRSAKYMASDLPDGVGPRVKAFVGRARFLVQSRIQNNPQWKVVCNLATCSCQMLCSEGAMPGGVTQANPVLNDLFGEPVTSSDEEESDDENTPPQYPVASYWATLSPKPLTTLPRRVFCSLACSLAYEDELLTCVPVRISEAESFETYSSANGKLGLSRTLASTRAAFKRNDSAARALREAMRTVKKRPASTIPHHLIARMHANIIDVLNVDLGLLYAASALAESPGSCQGRVLPATAPGWREADVRKFHRAIERVKSLYVADWRDKDGLARDERFPPPWLRKVREEAPRLFSVTGSV